MKRYMSFLIGLVIPYLSVVLGIYHYRFDTEFIFGFPPLYFWVFSWFILTSICISVSWMLDRKEYPEE